MSSDVSRSGLRAFTELLVKGQRVDWKHNLVVILVITGMFSTPLALGSIRNRVYVAVKDQIEKENNAREISLQLARDDAPPLDAALVARLETEIAGLRAVGNHKLVVSVEGPQGADLLTLQTLAPDDPRQDPLRILPKIPQDFGLTDLVVSDALGKVLYGEGWDALWVDGRFAGPPLTLRIHELPLTATFEIVARRSFPGRGLYGSQILGAALRRYTLGFGAAELGLPVDPELVELALPKLLTSSCLLLLETPGPSCEPGSEEQLLRRLRELQLELEPTPVLTFPLARDRRALRIALGEWVEEGGKRVRREMRGSCGEALAPHLVGTCGATLAVPDLAVELTLERASGQTTTATVVAADGEVRGLLAGIRELADRHGVAPATAGAIGLAVAIESGLELAEKVQLRLAQEWVPARIESFYACPAGAPCPLLADPVAVLRLRNLQEGTVEIFARDPLVFVPARAEQEYDEVLAYVARVEEVEAVSGRLHAMLPGVNSQYNVAALDNLRRQDARLGALFNLTLTLSAAFIVLALSALARINVERRSRQMAQMLLLGFSRRFVRYLVVAEYVLLTVLASLVAWGLTAVLCATARSFLAGSAGGDRGFEVIVHSMRVDAGAFLQVFAVVALCTWAIALLSARKAAKCDPLSLLD